MIPFVFGYSLYKRHLALQVTAFAQLSEREKQEKLDELHYQERTEALAIKRLEKTEKEEALDYQRQQTTLLKERIAVTSVKLDLEKKRAEYALQLTTLFVDTLYTGIDTAEMRVELVRNMLPTLKDIGQRESTTILLEHFQQSNRDTPMAIPVIAVETMTEERV